MSSALVRNPPDIGIEKQQVCSFTTGPCITQFCVTEVDFQEATELYQPISSNQAVEEEVCPFLVRNWG